MNVIKQICYLGEDYKCKGSFSWIPFHQKLLKRVRYLGRFYEYKGSLGWMPLHKAIFCSIVTLHPIHWVKQSDVKFD
jgi:hypothetical protein